MKLSTVHIIAATIICAKNFTNMSSIVRFSSGRRGLFPSFVMPASHKFAEQVIGVIFIVH